MSKKTFKVGLVGCGDISDIYIKNCRKFGIIDLVALANRTREKAEEKARQYSVPNAMGIEELMGSSEIDIVLNLTHQSAHFDLTMAALRAGKHVYSEKTLAVTAEQGREIVDYAHARNLLVGCAPDTFLGGRLQTCRKVIDEGLIGEPVAATAFMMYHGVEHIHNDPAKYYRTGAGPLHEMAPYYLTALVSLLGPAKRVSGTAKKTFEERPVIGSLGKTFPVEVPTHASATVEFHSGAVATMIASYDIWDSTLPRLEIYGTEGTLTIKEKDPLAGPNIFGGELHIRTKEETGNWHNLSREIPRPEGNPWRGLETSGRYNGDSRGLGLADLCCALAYGYKHRASAQVALHTLEIIEGVLAANESGRYVEIGSTCERPEPLPGSFPVDAKEQANP